MKREFAYVKNLRELSKAFQVLADENNPEPTMGLIYGSTGVGKTKSIAWLRNNLPTISTYTGIVVEMMASWSLATLVRSLVVELGHEPYHKNDLNVQLICREVASRKIAIFVDEANYLFQSRDSRMVDTLHDIYNKTRIPIILAGRDGIDRKVATRPHLDRRITQRVQFTVLDLGDTQLFCDTCAEVQIQPCLTQKIYAWSGGLIARVESAVAEIERLAFRDGMTSVDAEYWGDRPFRRER